MAALLSTVEWPADLDSVFCQLKPTTFHTVQKFARESSSIGEWFARPPATGFSGFAIMTEEQFNRLQKFASPRHAIIRKKNVRVMFREDPKVIGKRGDLLSVEINLIDEPKVVSSLDTRRPPTAPSSQALPIHNTGNNRSLER